MLSVTSLWSSLYKSAHVKWPWLNYNTMCSSSCLAHAHGKTRHQCILRNVSPEQQHGHTRVRAALCSRKVDHDLVDIGETRRDNRAIWCKRVFIPVGHHLVTWQKHGLNTGTINVCHKSLEKFSLSCQSQLVLQSWRIFRLMLLNKKGRVVLMVHYLHEEGMTELWRFLG